MGENLYHLKCTKTRINLLPEFAERQLPRALIAHALGDCAESLYYMLLAAFDEFFAVGG
jgi:hypothetical protein